MPEFTIQRYKTLTVLSIFAIVMLSVTALFFYTDNLHFQSQYIDRYNVDLCLETRSGEDAINNLSYCSQKIGIQAKLDDFRIRREAFTHQTFDGVIILFMVVTITFSGVYLSYLQLMSSLELAKSSSDLASQQSDLSIESGKISLKSAYVGLTLLGISFAFFAVFVFGVYRVEIVQEKQSARAPAASQINQTNALRGLKNLGQGGLVTKQPGNK